MSKIEIINLIGYSLFGLEIEDIYTSSKLRIIMGVVKKLETQLGYNFVLEDVDRYLYRKWGNTLVWAHHSMVKPALQPLVVEVGVADAIRYGLSQTEEVPEGVAECDKPYNG